MTSLEHTSSSILQFLHFLTQHKELPIILGPYKHSCRVQYCIYILISPIRYGFQLPLPTDEYGYCYKCSRNSRFEVLTGPQWTSFKNHLVKSKKHDQKGSDIWNCKVCGKSFLRKRDHERHPCFQKKTVHPGPDGESRHPVRYTRKPVAKNIHKQAKLWSASVMFGVAYEEKFCLPGNNFG